MDRKMLELTKIEAEIGKLIAETAKINAESRWYPIMIAAALMGAGAAIAKLFI